MMIIMMMMIVVIVVVVAGREVLAELQNNVHITIVFIGRILIKMFNDGI